MITKNFLLIILLQIFHHSSAFNQIEPIKSGVEQTKVDINAIHQIIESCNFKINNPGISVMVVHHQKVIYQKNNGLSNIKTKHPFTENTIFNMGSLTKQFTAFCILKLEEEGKLSTHDLIQKHIPELPDFGAAVTINHLLGHTSGIPDYIDVLGLQNRYKNSKLKAEYLLQFYENFHALSFQPGERFSYSNAGYMMLAMIVEKVSGMSFDAYAKKNIFIPLQMCSTVISKYEHDGIPDGTLSYYSKNNKFKPQKNIQPNALGATGLFGSLNDFKKWDDHFYHPSEATKNIISKMKKEYYFNNGEKSGYGAGILIKKYKGLISEEHSGGWNQFLVQCRRLPELNISIYVGCNTTAYNPFKICDEITDLFLPTKISAPDVTKSEIPNITIFTGNYLDASNVLRTIKLTNDTLSVFRDLEYSKILHTLIYHSTAHDTLILFTDAASDTLQFVVKNNQVRGFYWTGSTYFRFNRYYEKLDPNVLPEYDYAGSYTSEELKYSLKVKQKKENKFILKPIFFLNYSLDHLGKNVFKIKNEPIFIRFYHDHISVGNEWTSQLKLTKIK